MKTSLTEIPTDGSIPERTETETFVYLSLLSLCAYCLLQSPAADEMNNLDPVPVRKHRFWPVVAAHDLLIQLDRNAFRRQRKFLYQLAQLQSVANFADFTIDLNLQGFL